ncbi:TAXI family TRAP transporter solute-binding subunit [Glutamicibacter sp.]|uniref:TAXI family TRAP transporter solute-binding subunit n=1 Tax=Glutamicibacter sp. TaxID=1931995 RepID=UPI0028BDF3A1|nr:TAXI family TRAP transporter solute-binding subunit [Glutamicibacter sp.]
MSTSGITRRSLLRLSLGLPPLALAPVAIAGCNNSMPAQVNIAAGERGGMYFEFATLLADALVRFGIAKSSRVIETEASVQNLHMLASGQAQLSLALADTVAEYREELNAGGPTALGRIYQNYFHCIVRADEKIHTLNDLQGRRIGTGAAGSGTWVTGQRILNQSQLNTSRHAPHELKLGYIDGLAALEDRAIDALFLFGGMPVRAVAELARRIDLRLLNMDEVLTGLRGRYPGLYDPVEIPAGTYARVPESSSIGVANLLMAPGNMGNELVGKIVKMIVGHAQELIPRETAGMQFLSPQTLISTSGQPLHPGAIAAYRQLHG